MEEPNYSSFKCFDCGEDYINCECNKQKMIQKNLKRKVFIRHFNWKREMTINNYGVTAKNYDSPETYIIW